MIIQFSQNTVENVLRFWVETTHMNFQIGNILEYSDEVLEHYENENWFKDNHAKGDISVAGLYWKLKDTDEYSSHLSRKAEEKMKMVLHAMLTENGFDEIFPDTDVDKFLDDLFVSMYEEFYEKIYAYMMPDQEHNVTKYIKEYIESYKK